MSDHLARARGWWIVTALVTAGWVTVAAGQVLIGGVVMTAGCVVALLMRWLCGNDPRLGALILRSRPLDMWFYAVLTVNVLGATLLVTRHMSVPVLAAVDAVLVAVGAWIVFRPAVGRVMTR